MSTAFQVEVAKRIEDHAAALGHPRDYPVAAQDRARIRTQVAAEFFRAEHGRDPRDARELSGTIAKLSRPRTTAVAGYDLTFSPVKSVSTLWAIAPPRGRGAGRAGPQRGRRRRAGVHREARPVHPRGHQRGPPGRRHRAGRGRVHPPRLPRRRPRPAHPRRGREQGADPVREVAVASTGGSCSRPTSPPPRPTTPPWRSTCATRLGLVFAERAGHRARASARSARSSASTRA